MKISMASFVLALLAETAVAVNGGCKTGLRYCGSTLKAINGNNDLEYLTSHEPHQLT
jgi:hypothetical protein